MFLVFLSAVGALFQTTRPLVIPVEWLAAMSANDLDCRHANEFEDVFHIGIGLIVSIDVLRLKQITD